MKRRGNRTDEASNVEVTTNSILVDVARERLTGAIVDHLVDVVILGLPYRCWRCNEVSTPIVRMTKPGGKEELLGLAWQYLPAEARQHWRVGKVRNRHSRTTGST